MQQRPLHLLVCVGHNQRQVLLQDDGCTKQLVALLCIVCVRVTLIYKTLFHHSAVFAHMGVARASVDLSGDGRPAILSTSPVTRTCLDCG